MRTASARVLRGRVVTRAKLPEGARLTLFVHERVDVELDDEDEHAIAAGVAEVRAGRYASASELRRFLRRKVDAAFRDPHRRSRDAGDPEHLSIVAQTSPRRTAAVRS